MDLPEPLDVPVRRGLQFTYSSDPEMSCEVTDVVGGVVTWSDMNGEHREEESWFPDDVALILAPAPPAVANPSPTIEQLPMTPHEAVLAALDAAMITSYEDTEGQYSGQPLPSTGGYSMTPTDDFLREQINQFFDADLIDFREARRLRELLGDELPPVVRADDFD